jgi:hypothetical protein
MAAYSSGLDLFLLSLLGYLHCLVGSFPLCSFILGVFDCGKSNEKAPIMKKSGKAKTHKPKPAVREGS